MLKPFHLVAALALVVSACGSYQGRYYPQDCPADAAERVQAADWARVKTIAIRVRRDEFVPMVVTLTQNRPYVLRLENADRESHVFRAPDFFRAIAIESATVGGQELTEACPKRIILEAEESAELRFVAVRDGHYDYKDAPFPVTFGGGAIGVISIEPRGDYTVGSLNPVKIEEPAPATTSTPATPVKTAPSDNPFDTYKPPADDAGKAAPEAAPNPFDTYKPPADDAGKAAPDEAPNPFAAVEPAPDEAPNPFAAVEPAPDEAPKPFAAVEPAPDEAPNPFDAVEPAPDEAPNPFAAVQQVPAEADAPGPMVQTMPPGSPPPPPETDEGTDPFGSLEPDRSLPME